MNLYELSNEYQNLLDFLESAEASEYEEEFSLRLSKVEDEIGVKAENYFKIINQIKHDSQSVADEIKRLQAKKKALDNNQKRLTNTLYEEMEIMGIKKIKRPTVSIWIQNNPLSLEVTSTDSIPKDYLIEQEPKLDKRALLDHIKKTGELFDGVTLKQTRGVRFR